VKAALSKRVETLGNPRLTRFYAARMQYALALQGTASVSDPDGLLGGGVDATVPWPVELWCGAWDPDALCGFAEGFLGLAVATPGPAIVAPSADGGRVLLTEFASLARAPQQERRA
jgi:hypothetical protein